MAMTVSVVRLGSPRTPGEGLRIGTVRRPPRGVKKADFARRDFYDVWLPALAPSPALVRRALVALTAADWRAFERRYRAEMRQAEPSRILDLLAALSHQADFSVGCYCAEESHCHRSLLRKLLTERRARMK
jgi:uncharacterized protein YeaO (DUF488 family)